MNPHEPFEPGDVLMAEFPKHAPAAHEQEGYRPALVVALPPKPQRFDLLYVVPMTTARGLWAEANPLLYPKLKAGAGNLLHPSIVLLDQLRAIDSNRPMTYLGTLKPEVFEPLREQVLAIIASKAA